MCSPCTPFEGTFPFLGRTPSVILPLCVQVRAGNVLSNLLVARYFFILSVLLNDIYVFSIKMNSKVDWEVDEMLDVMMEGVVEVDKEVDEILMEKKWVKCSI